MTCRAMCALSRQCSNFARGYSYGNPAAFEPAQQAAVDEAKAVYALPGLKHSTLLQKPETAHVVRCSEVFHMVSARGGTGFVRQGCRRSGRRSHGLGGGNQKIETLAKKCQHHNLVGSELGVLALELLRDFGFNHLHEVT